MNKTWSVPSLKRLMVANTAISMCSKESLKSMITQIFCESYKRGNFEDDCNRKVILTKAAEEISLLCIPETLKTEILGIIWRVCLELACWLQYHFLNPGLRINAHMSNFCWTQQVRIDKKKTAERIIQDVTVPIEERYKLACLYCMETNIQALWDEMPVSTRQSLCTENDQLMLGHYDIVRVWTCHLLKGSIRDPIPNGGSVFWQVAQSGNKIATEYFFHRLNADSRNYLLFMCIKNVSQLMMHPIYTSICSEDLCEVFCFLLCHIREDHQMEIVKKNTYAFLWSFMCKLDLTDFMKIVNEMWINITATDFAELLSSTLFKYLKGYDDYDYRKVFEELWEQSTEYLKTTICATSHFGAHYLGMLLRDIFPFDTDENINLQKARFFSVYLKWGRSSPYGVKENHWRLLKFLIENGVSTKASVVCLKGIIDRLREESFNINVLEWEQRLRLIRIFLDVED